MKPHRFRGKSLDSLSLKEQWQLAGRWVALELYRPDTMPLRTIEAVGVTPAECLAQLAALGLDPSRFELLAIAPPYSH